MPIPLTLGVPNRPDARPLVDRLLLPRLDVPGPVPGGDADDSRLLGTPVIPLAAIPAGVAPGSVIVAVDLHEHDHESELVLPRGVSVHIDCPPDLLSEVLALPARAVVFLDGPVDVAAVRRVVSAGRRPGIDLAVSGVEIADFLAVLAHADTGFVARAWTGAQALAGIAATVAALRGDDVRTAFATPDVGALARLNPAAAEAVRDVLVGIEVTDPVAVARDLVVLS
ncbi:hypothetical protein OG921_03695 [Aldersonia sp. NBC_00410]|uniref:hypothetical protein n=1 Tax=Aldersonia sp. NBC_00410 TaxID=2975954 RepID=UPI0022536490|nr:hypothetical protein [Aldersonia sp. NBC_00410]MCX5042296.1 hypothetical protein [Aldersonia sp. NBC_00410]